jgi:FkbM family methyltransferase
MKNTIKNIIIKFIIYFKRFKIVKLLYDLIYSSNMNFVKNVYHNNHKLKFVSPNRLIEWRLNTFSLKEPETLEWIDSMPANSNFWDIGANIGLYSIYAALTKNCNVFSFEPSFFNLEVLGRNINLNNLQDSIKIFPIALFNMNKLDELKFTNTEWGGALSSFASDKNFSGDIIKPELSYTTVGMSMDSLPDIFNVSMPDFIKLDVDGIEHIILEGGPNILKNVKSILIEINDLYKYQSMNCIKILKDSGLVLKSKNQSNLVAKIQNGFEESYNQIWQRP